MVIEGAERLMGVVLRAIVSLSLRAHCLCMGPHMQQAQTLAAYSQRCYEAVRVPVCM